MLLRIQHHKKQNTHNLMKIIIQSFIKLLIGVRGKGLLNFLVMASLFIMQMMCPIRFQRYMLHQKQSFESRTDTTTRRKDSRSHGQLDGNTKHQPCPWALSQTLTVPPAATRMCTTSFFFLFPTTRLFAVWNYRDCSRCLSPYPNTSPYAAKEFQRPLKSDRMAQNFKGDVDSAGVQIYSSFYIVVIIRI